MILIEIGKFMNEFCKNILDLVWFESWLKNMEMKLKNVKFKDINKCDILYIILF